ncbi:MAG: type I-C CRISPR-associated protein Cas8c/Csd1 [Clostridia bacterium]|nr:type I-C CRISPR-associated protein Cas8c/Csd1 [Clostridia bacterium]
MQKAIETYDYMQRYVGIEREGKETLAPIGHIIARASIEITLDAEGKFIQARAVDQKIIIPVTEESSGRTSAPAAHALDEQLGYLIDPYSDKAKLFLEELREWMVSEYTSPKLRAVYLYVENGSIRNDLENAGLLKTDDTGSTKNEKELVCWRVLGLGENSGPVWRDPKLIDAYSKYYLERNAGKEKRLCMLTGEYTMQAQQHLKGVVSLNGNAKIISSNDHANFTYRGRFKEPEEACTVGYLASQKAHNALKWLVANDGVFSGTRTFLCWNPRGQAIPRATNPLIKRSEVKYEPSEYNEQLRQVLFSYKAQLPQSDEVIVAAFDAATTGRLAVTYYNELQASDFLDMLAYWDETCCWYDNRWGVSSPALLTIISCAFGTQHGDEGKIEADDKIIAQHMQRLLACRVDRSPFPQDILMALIRKADNLQVFSRKNRDQMLFTCCAVIRKYRIDLFKEEIYMALEPTRRDRSYQFGRLLAVLEKIEADTYDKSETRETNAIRLQSVFVRRPGYAAKIIMDQLKNGYYPRLKPGQRVFYDRLIGEIMEQLSQFPGEEYNKSLSETYLPGYYLQKNALYTKKELSDSNEEENEDEV